MKNNKKGFTLVELVIVVAVMAVLVAVAIPTVSSIIDSANQSVDQSNAKTIESMIKLAQAKADGATLGADAIDTALTDAALGIDAGDFTYNATTGMVTPGAATAKGDYNINFNSERTVTSGTGENQVTTNDLIVVTILSADVEPEDDTNEGG